ncbi:MAG: N-acyl-D-amino-acid deacylase family protein [Lachnospiraceae bacterium]
MRMWIKNAVIVDGSGEDRFLGSLLLDQDRIVRVISDEHSNEKLEEELTDADRILDAAGLICAPGFIDTHSHSDLKVLSDPTLFPKVFQGITSEVLGQDGISMAPLPLEFITPWRKNLAGLDGEDENLDWTYQTTENYLARIEAVRPALNEAYLLPHGNVRMEAMGLAGRAATSAEIQKMCEITRREMEAGCLGLSSGLIYMPCAYSHTEEIIEMCKVVKEYGGTFVVHQRSEADAILPSMDEIIRIGMESGVDVHFSHFKVCGKNNWDKLPAMLKKLEIAEKAGIHVTLDQYPYVAGSTMLGVILPPWAHDGGTDRLLERLANEHERDKMKKDIREGIEDWDNFIEFAGTDGIFITSVTSEKNSDAIGKSLDELAQMRNRSALDAAFDLLLEEKNAVGMVDFYGTEDHVKEIMGRPEMNLCTDGLLSGKPHPRAYGAFPRMIGKYVRDENVMSLETAVYKMTKRAADSLKISERGLIREGYYADLTIFDYETIRDMGDFTVPEQFPEGIVHVFVNGEMIVENGIFTDHRCGKVIRLHTADK